MPTHPGYVNVDADSIAILAGELALEGQSPWTYYNGADAPEGAYDYVSAADATATITLPTNLTAGTWYIFLYFMDYDQHRTVYYTLGSDTSSTIATDNRDFNRYWSVRATLTVTTPGSSLVAHFGNNAGSSSDHMFRGLYLTTNANVTVTADGIAVNLTAPTVMDDSAAVPGNLIPNSGFEAGVDAAWGLSTNKEGTLASMVDHTVGHIGSSSIKLPLDITTNLGDANSGTSLNSRVYHLKPNKKYTFSFWAKTSTGTVSIAPYITNTYNPPSGFDPQYYVTSGHNDTSSSSDMTATTTWKRFYTTGYLVAYPSPDWNFTVLSNPATSTYLYVTDIQLEEGDLTTYAASATLECIVTTDKPGNVFWTTDTIQGTLRAHNNSGGTVSKRLQYRIYDFSNHLIVNSFLSVSVAATTADSSSFDLSVGGLTGLFRLVYWLENVEGSEKEMMYSVVPVPATTGLSTTSHMGIHPNYIDHRLAIMQRLGIHWSRDLSPQALFRWSSIEPTEGSFTWYDAEIALCESYGLTTLGVLGVAHPSWADDGTGKPDLTKWAAFVTAVVNHYKAITPPVKYWEIWNEPFQGGLSANFYAQMLKGAVDAIEAEDATAKIVGFGGPNSATYINDVLTQLGSLYPTWVPSAHLDVYSVHCYPYGATPESFTTYVNGGMPVWNTESGTNDSGSYQGNYSNFVAWGKPILRFQDSAKYYIANIGNMFSLVNTFARTIAAKQDKFFYYDSRILLAPDYRAGSWSIIEYDESVSVKGVAYSIAGSFLDYTVGQGDQSADAESMFLTYDTGGDPVACLFSTDNHPRQVALTGVSHGDIQMFDIMGNSVSFTGTTIPYGRLAVYLRGVGISLATLNAALSGGTITTRSDTTLPTCIISSAPKAPLAVGIDFRVRWLGTDDISWPNFGEVAQEAGVPADAPAPNAILYSYRLTPYSSYSAWVANTYADYSDIPAGAYSFDVKAKDEAGNESIVASQSITVGDVTRYRRSLLLLS